MFPEAKFKIDTLCTPLWQTGAPQKASREIELPTRNALNSFFGEVERRAFVMANLASGNREDALEIVQEAMLGLSKNYAHKSHEEWRPLFYTILHSKINDFHRRKMVRNKVMGSLRWLGGDDDPAVDPIEEIAGSSQWEPVQQLQDASSNKAVMAALKALPLRQQQAFILRNWEGLSVEQTAQVIGCSGGSVKTHYFRALKNLRERLKEFRT